MRLWWMCAIAVLVVAGPASPTPEVAEVCRVEPHEPQPPPQRTLDRLSDLDAVIAPLRARFGAERVLFVFDIDNTRLTAEADFGSDAWFEWQEALLNRPACADPRVSNSFGGLLDVQSLAYAVGEPRATEPMTASRVSALAARGDPVMALTARRRGAWRQLSAASCDTVGTFCDR